MGAGEAEDWFGDRQVIDLNGKGTLDLSVGESGVAESMIPIWGSGRDSINHFQKGNYVRGTLFAVFAVSDVFFVASIFTAGSKLGARSVVQATMDEAAENVAKKSLQKSSESGLVHLTTEAAEIGIEQSGKLGSKWGVFALIKVPSSNLARQVSTLVPKTLTTPIQLGARAARNFTPPPITGIFSGARYALGVQSAPLGSFVLKTGEFLGGEILKKGVFRTATRGEYAKQLLHQWVLDYLPDAIVNFDFKNLERGIKNREEAIEDY